MKPSARHPSESALRRALVGLHAAAHAGRTSADVGAPGSQAGQSTVEYALILLGAAAIALALVSWVTGSNVVGRLFDAVVGRILDRV